MKFSLHAVQTSYLDDILVDYYEKGFDKELRDSHTTKEQNKNFKKLRIQINKD
jgi:hypothetical protein